METPSQCLKSLEAMRVELGSRPTKHPIHIARFVLGDANHPTAKERLAWTDRHLPKISGATVYNRLGESSKAGLGGKYRFPQIPQTVQDKNTEHHFHFHHQASASILTFDVESVRVDLRFPSSFKVNFADIPVSGNCSQ